MKAPKKPPSIRTHRGVRSQDYHLRTTKKIHRDKAVKRKDTIKKRGHVEVMNGLNLVTR